LFRLEGHDEGVALGTHAESLGPPLGSPVRAVPVGIALIPPCARIWRRWPPGVRLPPRPRYGFQLDFDHGSAPEPEHGRIVALRRHKS
jgi:hypothetical protein